MCQHSKWTVLGYQLVPIRSKKRWKKKNTPPCRSRLTVSSSLGASCRLPVKLKAAFSSGSTLDADTGVKKKNMTCVVCTCLCHKNWIIKVLIHRSKTRVLRTLSFVALATSLVAFGGLNHLADNWSQVSLHLRSASSNDKSREAGAIAPEGLTDVAKVSVTKGGPSFSDTRPPQALEPRPKRKSCKVDEQPKNHV